MFEKLYQNVRRITLKRKLKLINEFCEADKKHLLDFGCGTGDFLKLAQEHHWNVNGIEPNTEARAIANLKTKDYIFNTDKLSSFNPNSFNVITLWHVLEHVSDLEDHIITFKKLLTKEGALVIAVPNYKSYDATHYKKFWAAYDVPRHLWHFSQTSIEKLFSKHDMKIVKTLPMYFDAFYVSLLSEKYKSGFMNPFKAFWIGLVSNLKAKRSGEYSSLIYIIKNN